MTRDRLDELLGRWASSHVPDDVHACRIVGEITEELNRARGGEIEPFHSRRSSIRLRRGWVYAAMGAAVLLFLATIPSFLNRSRFPDAGDEPSAARVALVGKSDLEADARLFCETERLFGDQLRWIAENRNDVRMEIRRTSGGISPEAMPLLMRVVVVRKARDAGWAPVFDTTVVARDEELVEKAPISGGGNRLALWGYALPDGKIAMEASIHLVTPFRADVDVTNVLEPGEPKKVFSIATEAGEYRIYEVAIPLPQHGNAPCTST